MNRLRSLRIVLALIVSLTLAFSPTAMLIVLASEDDGGDCCDWSPPDPPDPPDPPSYDPPSYDLPAPPDPPVYDPPSPPAPPDPPMPVYEPPAPPVYTPPDPPYTPPVVTYDPPAPPAPPAPPTSCFFICGLQDAVNNVTTTVNNAVNTVTTTVSNVVDSVTTTISDVVDTATAVLTDVIDAVSTAVDAVTTAVSNIVDAVTTGVSNLVDTVVTGTSNLVDTLVSGASSTWDGMVSAAKIAGEDFFYGLAETTKAVGDTLAETAGPVLRGAAYGIADWWGKTEDNLNSTDPGRQANALLEIFGFAATAASAVGALRAVGARVVSGATADAAGVFARSYTIENLPSGVMGATDMFGNILIRPGLSPAELAITLRHETVHSVIQTALKFEPLQRAAFFLYDKVGLVRYAMEATAEGYGTQSLLQGLRFPVIANYVSAWRLGLETAVLGALGLKAWQATQDQ